MRLSPCYHRTFACVLCVCLLNGPCAARAEQATQKKPHSTKTSEQSPAKSETPAPVSSPSPTQDKASRDQAVAEFEAKLAGVFDPTHDNSDYVPCFFTVSQLQALRPLPPTPQLTREQAENLVSAVMAQVLSAANAKIFGDAERAEMIKEMSQEDFEGLTPSAALGRVILILQHAEKAPGVVFAKLAADSTGSLIGSEMAAQLIDAAVDQARETALKKLSPPNSTSLAALEAELQEYRNHLESLKFERMTGPQAISTLSSDSFSYLPQRKSVLNEQRQKARSAAAADHDKQSVQTETAELQTAAAKAAEAEKTAAGEDAALAGAGMTSNTVKAATTDHSAANTAIVDNTRSQLASFKRPPDVACAMSVLSWSETRFAFGRLIANEYIGVQVVVRNINDKQEFLLHDAAIAVDSDLTGREGRFFSGRDKVIVRALTVDQKDDSPRNIFINVISGVGILLTTIVPFAGAVNFTDAATAWNTALVPGIGKAWTDNGTDQLKLLDDIGFSSATNQKTVVPKSGTVMFVMFVPSKPFQQGWWTQPCAETLSNGVLLNPQNPPQDSTSDGSADSSGDGLAPVKRPVKINTKIGIDLNRAYSNCRYPETREEATVDYPTHASTGSYDRFRAIPYKRWSPNADAIFRELVLTVISGVHIQEESQTKPSLTGVKCPLDKLENVDLSKQSNGAVSCDITGQNLAQVDKLRLRNSEDEADSKTAEGKVTVSGGDTTSAKVSFPLSEVGPLEKPTYKVYTVTKDGVEAGGEQKLHFGLTPVVQLDPKNPYEIDLAKLNQSKPSADVTFSGYHLDHVTRIQFTSEATKDKSPAGDADVKNPTATSITFTFKPTKPLTDAASTKPVSVTATLVTSDKTQPDPAPTATLNIKPASASMDTNSN